MIENQLANPVDHGTIEIESSRAVAETQAQVIMAKKYPRDPVQALDKILAECRRPTLAEQAKYAYPRGGQMVEGPSIRLAEMLARNWGNISFGLVEVDRRGDESSMLAYAWDMETNVVARQEFKVKHIRDTKEGQRPLREERDVYELTTNQGSRRLRACILRIIPGDIIDSALAECESTLQENLGNVQDRIPVMIEKFKELGVTKLQLEKRLRHRIETLNRPELIALGKIYNSIKDGLSVPSDYFEFEEAKNEGKNEKSSATAMAEKLANKIQAEKNVSDDSQNTKSNEQQENELGIF